VKLSPGEDYLELCEINGDSGRFIHAATMRGIQPTFGGQGKQIYVRERSWSVAGVGPPRCYSSLRMGMCGRHTTNIWII
jgi:hypothetical protein